MSTKFWDTYVDIFSEKSGLSKQIVTESLVKMVGEPGDKKVFLLIDEKTSTEQDFREFFPQLPKILLRGVLIALRKNLPDYDLSVYGESVVEAMHLKQQDFFSYQAFLTFKAGFPGYVPELDPGDNLCIYRDVSQGLSSPEDLNSLVCVRVNVDRSADPLIHLKKFGPLTGLCDLPRFFQEGKVPQTKFLVMEDKRPMMLKWFIFPGTILSIKEKPHERFIPAVTFTNDKIAHFRLFELEDFDSGSIYMIIERRYLPEF